jgi:hypothetical protein
MYIHTTPHTGVAMELPAWRFMSALRRPTMGTWKLHSWMDFV